MKKKYMVYGCLAVGVLAVTVIAGISGEKTIQENAREQQIDLNAVVEEQTTMQESEAVISNGVELDAPIKEVDANEQIAAQGTGTASDGSTADGTNNGTTGGTATDGADDGTTGGAATDGTNDSKTDETTNEEPKAPAKGYDGTDTISWPVTGNVILPYSMDTTVYFQTLAQYRCNPGMLIQSVPDTDVVAVYRGTVKSVEESSEYGTKVVLDLGNGYEAIYGQVKDVRVVPGDMVTDREVIGAVAEPTAYYAKEGTHLYFQMNLEGSPINPMTILE